MIIPDFVLLVQGNRNRGANAKEIEQCKSRTWAWEEFLAVQSLFSEWRFGRVLFDIKGSHWLIALCIVSFTCVMLLFICKNE